MNVYQSLAMDKKAFFRFIERQAEGKFEFDHGRVVQLMTGGTFDHSTLVTRLIAMLGSQLNISRWVITSQNRGVETEHTVRYPDVVVERVGAAHKSLATNRPLLIVEVLSPSTEGLDLNVKPREYGSLRTLAAYIVASQDEPLCFLWSRAADGTYPERPVTIKGRRGIIDVAALGIGLRLSELYKGL